jgi:hypothetical protein
MKTLSCIAASFVFTVCAIGSTLDLAKAIHYVSPTNFHGGLAHPYLDPGDNPLSLDSPDFLQYADRTGGSGEVMFRLGLIGAYIGDGKIVHFLPVTPSLMKEEIESEYKKKLPNLTSPTIGKINGLTAVSLTAFRPTGNPNFFCFNWIQVETNIAVKVTAIASDVASFQKITNSLKTITIDKKSFLEALKPKDADVVTNHLEGVEIGSIKQNGQGMGVCVLHTKNKIYSISGGISPSSTAAFQRLRDFSNISNALRVVLINIAPDIPQTDLTIVAETNAAAIGPEFNDLQSPNHYFNIPPVALVWHFVENEVPKGFQKEAEYKMNAILYIRKEPSDTN